MKKYKFTEIETDPLAYSCDNFGDNSGEYVKADEAERKIEELRAIADAAIYALHRIDLSSGDTYAAEQDAKLSKRMEAINE